VAFTSDAHLLDTDQNNVAGRITSWLNGVSTAIGGNFDTLCYNGDMGDGYGTLNETQYWNAASILINTITSNPHVKSSVFTTGNHDVLGPGYYKSSETYTSAQPQSKITRVGEPANYGKNGYQVFCFGANESTSNSFKDADIFKLEGFLADCDPDQPVFVLSHFPLHNYKSRTITNADAVIEVLNDYPNVIFVWGHNHTESDPHYGKVYTEKLDGTSINFIYASAGCMSDSEYSTGSHAVNAKGMVAAMDGDSTLTLTYYDIDQKPLGSYEVDIADGSEVKAPLPENEDTGHCYLAASALADGAQYVISAEEYGMTSATNTGYVNASNFTYSGFDGYELDIDNGEITAGMKNAMLWTAHQVDGGWTFTNADGQYLCSTYSSTDPKGGSIFLSADAETWTYSGGVLKSTVSAKYLTWENEGDVTNGHASTSDGDALLFSIRSTGDPVTFYRQSDLSEKPTIPEIGDYQLVTALKDGGKYLIGAESHLICLTPNSGYTNASNFTYSGLDGIADPAVGGLIRKSTVEKNASLVILTAHKQSSGWTFSNAAGLYLRATYSSKTPKGGQLFFSETADTWTYSGGTLKSASAGKSLTWEKESDATPAPYTGNVDFFTIRSTGDTISFYEQIELEEEPVPSNYTKVKKLTDDDWFVISADDMGLTSTENEGYVNGQGYSYAGFDGVLLDIKNGGITSGVSADMLWKANKVTGGYTLMNKDRLYLAATYGTKRNGGDLYLSETPFVWIYSGGTLHTVVENDKKVYLTWETEADVTDGHGEGSDGDALLFSIRSSGDAVTLFKVADDVIKPDSGTFHSGNPVPGDVVVISMEGEGLKNDLTFVKLSIITEEQPPKAVAAVPVPYAGLTLKQKLTKETPESMRWTVGKSGETYSFSNGGKYLGISGNAVALVDEPCYWNYTANGLQNPGTSQYLTNSEGSALLSTESAQELTLFIRKEPAVITYQAEGHGYVTPATELVVDGCVLRGSRAVADQGYHLEKWIDAEGKTISTGTTRFVPTSEEEATYTAVFAEDPEVTIQYIAGPHGKVTNDSESVAPVTGNPAGSQAIPDSGYHFLYWQDTDGNQVSEIESFVPEKTNGVYIAATYTAVFEKDPECLGEQQSALKDGKLEMFINGTSAGIFLFTRVADCWTIQNPTTGLYLAAQDGKIVEQEQLFHWCYNGGLYYTVRTYTLRASVVSAPYYLTMSSGKLAPTLLTTDVTFVDHFAIMDHALTYVNQGKSHLTMCSVCGKSTAEAHTYQNGTCIYCKAKENAPGCVTGVNVSQTEGTARYLLFFKRTVYNIKISPVTTDTVTVKNCRYSLDGETWTKGTALTSTTQISSLYVEVTDSTDTVTLWHYDGTTTTAVFEVNPAQAELLQEVKEHLITRTSVALPTNEGSSKED